MRITLERLATHQSLILPALTAALKDYERAKPKDKVEAAAYVEGLASALNELLMGLFSVLRAPEHGQPMPEGWGVSEWLLIISGYLMKEEARVMIGETQFTSMIKEKLLAMLTAVSEADRDERWTVLQERTERLGSDE